jgi:2-dehydropantoate 2-reductase
MEPLHVVGAGSIGLFVCASIRTAFPSYPLAVLFRRHHKFSKRLAAARKSSSGEIVVCTRGGTGITFDAASSSSSITRPKQRLQRPRIARVPFQFVGDDVGDDDGNGKAASNNNNGCSSTRARPQRQRPRIRNLILCTKAYQVEGAIRDVRARLLVDGGDDGGDADDESSKRQHHPPRIIILCNGALDVRETVLRVLKEEQEEVGSSSSLGALSSSPPVELVMCTTTHGVVHETPPLAAHADDDDDDSDDGMFHLLHVGMGRTYVGGNINNPSLAQLWDRSGLVAEWLPPHEMEALLWKKLAANCVCNPLTALWGIPNGQLLDQSAFASIRGQIVEEISKVGMMLVVDPRIQPMLTVESLDRFVEQVIQANLHNTSSMHRDVQNRRRTEVDSLNGYVVRKSHELGLAAPANEDLLGMVKDVTRGYR